MSSSEEWPVSKVRQTFVDFFVQKQGHTFVPSSPVVPYEDPTLLFTNAGMNQFKAIFLGQVDPKNPMSKLKRATNSQKCIRAGGKHNDLEDVGKDTYHHTLFEMLGNWSFGDYFKKEAIEWAWTLLVDIYKLPVERIYVTYFGGDVNAKLDADDEARQLWLKYLPPERVLPFGMKDNFWEMGDTGPCGPCSEIHFDRIGGRDASHLVNRDDPTVIEVWNLVFMQFNREGGGVLKPLPAKHVDTGMGLERITSILQHKMSNYDTDAFTPIFDEIQRLTGVRKYTAKVGAEDTDGVDMAYRVIADHIRTVSFAIADGAMPGSEGRNYVLRRILRRAIRYGHDAMKAEMGFFSKLVNVVVSHMKDFFPELGERCEHIKSVIYDEEVAFGKTLKQGIELLKKAMANRKDTKIITGEDAFTLYSTYGFPLDLTLLMAAEKGYTVDVPGYEAAMERFKNLNIAQTGATGAMKLDVHSTAQLNRNGLAPTDDEPKFFLESITAEVKAIWNGTEFVQAAKGTESFGIVLDRTNFYAEAGGQIFDTGVLSGSNSTFDVENVQSFAGYILHIGKLKGGEIKVGETVTCTIDAVRRAPIMINHTSTHILNFALKYVLKNGKIDQKGSLVDPEKLRFDFTYNKPLTVDELAEVERICNDIITKGLPVYRQAVPLETARKIYGVRAVFGESYPDPVTVVSIGKPVSELVQNLSNPEWGKYSIEFCGGTHLKNTNEAKELVIISEKGIAAGVRRIIAWTGAMASKAYANADEFRVKLAGAKSKKGEELQKLCSSLNSDLESKEEFSLPSILKPIFQKEISALLATVGGEKKSTFQSAVVRAQEIIASMAESKRNLVVEEFDLGADRKSLGKIVDMFKEKTSAAVMLFSRDSKQFSAIAFVPRPLQGKLQAGQWSKEVSDCCGGRGGGKAESAQSSGPVAKFDEALAVAKKYAEAQLK